jgi:hypothetical protein
MIEFSKYIETLQRSYFTILIIFFLELSAIFLAIKNIRKQTIGKYFIFYLFFDLVILLFDFWFDASRCCPPSFRHKFISSTNLAIGLIELLVYFNYFKNVLPAIVIKRSLTAIQIMYSLIVGACILLILYHPAQKYDYLSFLIGDLEFILLIPPCIFYFQEILKVESNFALFDRPSFWIVTGVFFYAAASIPFYLLKKYLDNINYEFKLGIAAAFYYTPIIIHLGFLTKAFVWKKPITM